MYTRPGWEIDGGGAAVGTNIPGYNSFGASTIPALQSPGEFAGDLQIIGRNMYGPRDRDAELIQDLFQIGLDVGGIVEPTPFCDLTSGVISASNGEFAMAGISVVSLVPWIGDLAKAGKLPKFGRVLAKVINRMEDSAAFAERAAPYLRKVNGAIDTILDSPKLKKCLPGNTSDQLRILKKQIDDVLGNVGKKKGRSPGTKINPDGTPKNPVDQLDQIKKKQSQNRKQGGDAIHGTGKSEQNLKNALDDYDPDVFE